MPAWRRCHREGEPPGEPTLSLSPFGGEGQGEGVYANTPHPGPLPYEGRGRTARQEPRPPTGAFPLPSPVQLFRGPLFFLKSLKPIARREKWSSTIASQKQKGNTCGSASGKSMLHGPPRSFNACVLSAREPREQRFLPVPPLQHP